MRIAASAFALLVILAGPASAQRVVMKNGPAVNAVSLSRSGTNVTIVEKLANGQVSRSVPVSAIERIDFPEPPDLLAAQQNLDSGNAALALAKVNPVLAAQLPFRDVPGNFWGRAASIKLAALNVLRLEDQIGPLVAEISRYSKDPEMARVASLYEARKLLKQGNAASAVGAARNVIKDSKSSENIANAWLVVGAGEIAQKNYRAALLAYLHVPVFFPDNKVALPAALLGAARALEGMEDFSRSKDSLDRLMTDYANSPEATEAKEDLKRVTRQLNKVSAQ